MPEVSIIVPVYNVEKYLNRCVDSILNQTFTDFELILVDDGSPDNSGKICDEYAKQDGRVKVIHKENSGVSAARNTGIDEAQGKYIMFLDSDDELQLNALETMYKCALNNYCDLVMCGLKYQKPSGQVIYEKTCQEFQCRFSDFIKEYAVEAYNNHLFSAAVAKLYKKSIISNKSIRFNESISICEDGLFVCMFMQNIKSIANIPDAFYCYNQYDEESLMKRFNLNSFDGCSELYLNNIILFENNNSSNEDIRLINQNYYMKFIGFLIQLYNRSSLSFFKKYTVLKGYLNNSVFIKLQDLKLNSGIMHRLLYVLRNMKAYFAIHCILFIRYSLRSC